MFPSFSVFSSFSLFHFFFVFIFCISYPSFFRLPLNYLFPPHNHFITVILFFTPTSFQNGRLTRECFNQFFDSYIAHLRSHDESQENSKEQSSTSSGEDPVGRKKLISVESVAEMATGKEKEVENEIDVETNDKREINLENEIMESNGFENNGSKNTEIESDFGLGIKSKGGGGNAKAGGNINTGDSSGTGSGTFSLVEFQFKKLAGGKEFLTLSDLSGWAFVRVRRTFSSCFRFLSFTLFICLSNTLFLCLFSLFVFFVSFI